MARCGLKLGSNSHLIFHGQESTNSVGSGDCQAPTASTEGSCDIDVTSSVQLVDSNTTPHILKIPVLTLNCDSYPNSRPLVKFWLLPFCLELDGK